MLGTAVIMIATVAVLVSPQVEVSQPYESFYWEHSTKLYTKDIDSSTSKAPTAL